MADDNKTEAQAGANAPAKVAAVVAETATKVVRDTAKADRAAAARSRRQAKRDAPAKTARAPKAARRTTRSTATAAARPTTARKAAAAAAAAAPRTERTTTMNTTDFAGMNGMMNFAPFQNLFAGAGERSQDVVRRGQKAAEDMADLTRSNVEAIVEAGRLATEGARSIGQDVVARGRQGVEQTADAIRTLAEAKSPTEFVQLQSELARTSFDRMVAETSRLTESMVKLAGEAFQPLSNRASANVQRINTFVA
jgi:phasin family protein